MSETILKIANYYWNQRWDATVRITNITTNGRVHYVIETANSRGSGDTRVGDKGFVSTDYAFRNFKPLKVQLPDTPNFLAWRNYVIGYYPPKVGDVYVTRTGSNMYRTHKRTDFAPGDRFRFIMDPEMVEPVEGSITACQLKEYMPDTSPILGDGGGDKYAAASGLVGMDFGDVEKTMIASLGLDPEDYKDKLRNMVALSSDCHLGHMHSYNHIKEEKSMLELKLSVVRERLEAAKKLRIETAQALVDASDSKLSEGIADFLSDPQRLAVSVEILEKMPEKITEMYDIAIDRIDVAAQDHATKEELGFDYQDLVKRATNLSDFTEKVVISG